MAAVCYLVTEPRASKRIKVSNFLIVSPPFLLLFSSFLIV